jgi:hypothetical protein
MLAGPAQMMQISDTVGVRVLEVLPDSPAAAAGLQAGDQIIAVDGEPLSPGRALAATLETHKPGDEIILEVQSDIDAGETREVTVTLGEHPDASGAAFLGIRMAPMISWQAEYSAPFFPGRPLGEQYRFFRPPRMEHFRLRQPPFMAAPAMPSMPPMMVAPYGYGTPRSFPFAAPQGDFFYWLAPVQPGWMPAPMFQYYAAPFAYPPGWQMGQDWTEAAPPDIMFEAAPGQEPAEFEITLDEAI